MVWLKRGDYNLYIQHDHRNISLSEDFNRAKVRPSTAPIPMRFLERYRPGSAGRSTRGHTIALNKGIIASKEAYFFLSVYRSYE